VPRNSSILVVEDEAIIAMDLVQHLNDFGYRVVGVAHTADDAVARAAATKPDLVLMDIVLVGAGDGVAAADLIREQFDIPVVYLTAHSDADTLARAVQSAPAGFLTKPFNPRELRATIETVLYKSILERRLAESERWLASTLRCVGDGVFATDAQGRVRFMNPTAECMTGVPLAQAIGQDIAQVLKFAGDPGEHVAHAVLRQREQSGIVFGTQLVHSSGRHLPVADSAAPIITETGDLLGAVVVISDVRERIELENELRASEQRFASAFLNAANGMCLIDLHGRFMQVNPMLCQMLDRDEASLLDASHLKVVHPDYRAAEEDARRALLAGEIASFQAEHEYLTRGGQRLWVLVSAARVDSGKGEPFCFVYQIHDIRERKRVEGELVRLAHFDPLTGLPNRALLEMEAERAVELARRHGRRLAVLFLDIDRFQHVNDTLGHRSGDVLLQAIAERLHAGVRHTDIVGRLGGDEFVVIADVERPQIAMILASKLHDAVAAPVRIDERELSVSVSVGISIYPEDGRDAGVLFRNADSALHQSKADGRDAISFYRTELTERSDRRLRLETELRRALEQDRFVLHYQPIVDAGNGRIKALEALLRWQREDRLESPAGFIALAEESGLIVPIGEWVIARACRDLATWTRAGHEDIGISVNVSARQLRGDEIVAMVRRTLAANGIAPSRLCLEITEYLLVGGHHGELDTLHRLRELGVTIAIDDFGTGYSSLAYLKRFAPDCLKIDRSFVRDLARDPGDAAIVSGIMALAHKLGIHIVVEGVEDAGQLAFLRREGGACDLQGYLVSRPVPIEQVEALLTSTTLLPPD
jgi:diguanylate cyclase (GGDEF)-like protein/PAS domain S-box-containing protein